MCFTVFMKLHRTFLNAFTNKHCYVTSQHEKKYREYRHCTGSLKTQAAAPDYLLLILVDELN